MKGVDNTSSRRYKFGVLEGNWVEERFGLDLAEKQKPKTEFVTTSKASFSKRSSLHNAQQEAKDPAAFDLQTTRRTGVDKTLVFGHGPNLDNFVSREFRTSYELGFINKVPPHKTVDSHFVAPPPVERPPAIPPQPQTKQAALPKAYSEFTRKFDSTSNKLNLRS